LTVFLCGDNKNPAKLDENKPLILLLEALKSTFDPAYDKSGVLMQS
jgi:hypothetical protein